MGPILHWIQSGLTGTDVGTTLSSNVPAVASFLAPSPPPGSGPHRYVFLLYEQPEGFDVKRFAPANGQEMGIMQRVRYDLANFEKEAGLGPVVAANYFTSN